MHDIEPIEKAESILLPEGHHFDAERVRFINRWDSGDLLAVPGSGKTTALRAKLYCMAQNLPLDDGKGILAISHTNVAVEELKNKLQHHCPQLFEYPNFVGTIQDFVDTFLALPYYIQRYGHKVDVIDADRYEQLCEIKMRYAKEELELDKALEKEWIITNGIGGFASSTIIGANTRRYHGLLIAPLMPPARRTLILSKLDESIEIDNWKDEQHKKHGLKTIRINCFKSDMEYIKNSIFNSELINIFDLSCINWFECDKFSICTNIIKSVCDYYNINSNINKTEIANHFNLCLNTICKYLKKGNEFGWCKYDPKESLSERSRKLGIKNSFKVGIYKDKEGNLFAIKPVCTHLGCELSWNNLAKTWDCPCHGSRFTYTGESIYEPSIKNLKLIN